MALPKTLQEAILYFADFENCKAFMTDLRWPDGKVKCPRCDAEKVTWLAKARVWKCYGKHESPTFSLKTGTIFEDSPISLDKWIAAAWLLVTCKNGISSYEVSRDLGISQKSTWHMMHRLRFALHGGSFEKLTGHVEIDETFIGGKARNMHKSRKLKALMGSRGGVTGKPVVMGMLQRGGKVRTSVIGERDKPTLHAEVNANVRKGSKVYTDELIAYWGLEENYAHQIINHAEEYVNGKIHTNGMENFWSLVKRGLHGTYVSVEPFHLFRYLDEQAYRYNNRKHDSGELMTDYDRFKLAMAQIVGKRLTWDQLTGKEQDGRPTEVSYFSSQNTPL
jgi:transposase-like protein